MQPLVLSIPGDFWDVQIYRGRLYLWHYDGHLSVYDWERLVELAYPGASQSLAVKAAWLRGNSLYNSDVRAVFEDPAFRNVLDMQYARLVAHPPVITPNMLRQSLYGEQDNPVKELSTDTQIFNNILYLVTYGGLWSATVHRNNRRYPVSSKPQKRWDAQLYSAAAAHGLLALSAGDDGLFEYDLRDRNRGDDFDDDTHFPGGTFAERAVRQLTHRHSSYADWAFASVYSTSLISGSYLLAFDWQPDPAETQRLRRTFVREIDESEILRRRHKASLSWGAGDKICGLSGAEMEVVRYVQKHVRVPTDEELFVQKHVKAPTDEELFVQKHVKAPTDEGPFESVGTIRLSAGSEVVKAGLAYFGVLLETTDRLLVYRSDDEVWSIPGPIVRWRTYPRAAYYENHLHVVVQDAVHIVAFMHDYWQPQERKIAGVRYRARRSAGQDSGLKRHQGKS